MLTPTPGCLRANVASSRGSHPYPVLHWVHTRMTPAESPARSRDLSLFRPDQVVENPPGSSSEDSPARGGKDHAASHPQEKRRIEPRLDFPQLVAQGRLGEVKAGGGAGHAAAVGDAGDEPQVLDVEIDRSSTRRV